MARSVNQLAVAFVVCGSLFSFGALAAPAAAEAPQPPPGWRAPGYDDPLSIDIGIGPAVALDTGASSAFQIRESISYHFSGSDEGFHLGAALGQVFIPDSFLFEVGPRVGWDVKFVLDRNLALGLDPYITLGLGLYARGNNGPRDVAAFEVAPGVDVKLFVGGTFYAFVRPLAFDFLIQDRTAAYYDILFGVGGRF